MLPVVKMDGVFSPYFLGYRSSPIVPHFLPLLGVVIKRLIWYDNTMTERKRRFPDWAERERGGDMAWLRENLHVFWPLAQLGFQEVGRGAIVVDTTELVAHPTGMGHPLGYLDKETIAQQGDEDTLRLVGEYEPTGEFVSVLLKPQDRQSSYRVRVVPGEPGGKPAK